MRNTTEQNQPATYVSNVHLCVNSLVSKANQDILLRQPFENEGTVLDVLGCSTQSRKELP